MDSVILLDSFEHFKDSRNALREFCRLVRPWRSKDCIRTIRFYKTIDVHISMLEDQNLFEEI